MRPFRPRLLRLEDRVTPVGNLHLTAALFVDGSNVAQAAPVTGQMVNVRASWTTTGLAGGEQYVVRYTVDGVSVDSTQTGAVGTDLSYSLRRNGWYAAPGTHTVTVTLDPADAVAETDETDNSLTFDFTTAAPTGLPAGGFRRPLAGTLNRDWAINNYADVDPRPGLAADYRGGPFRYDGHDAVDAHPFGFDRMDAGMAVYAAAAGTVTQVQDGYFDRETTSSDRPGNFVHVDHGNGWSSLYYHFARNTITVQAGDGVTAGQVLGLMGSSGNSTSAHVHFTPFYRNAPVEMGYDPAAYEADPMPYGGDVAAFLFDAGVTNVNPGPDIREHPSPISSFGTTQGGQLYFWATGYGADSGDVLAIKYYQPNGGLVTTSTFNTTQSFRFLWWQSTVGLSFFQPAPGTWQVAWEMNGVEQRRVSFTVTPGGAVPSIRVTEPAGPIVLDRRITPYDFGSVAAGGAGPQRTFTVNNHGAAALTLADPVLPPGFSLVGGLPASIPAGGSATVTVALDTAVVGAKFGTIEFTTNDPDTPVFHFNVSGTVTGSAPAGTPAVTLPGPATAYDFGGPPQPLAPTATVTDGNSPNLAGGQLVVEFAGNGAATDRLGILNQGTGVGQVGLAGATVTFGGVPIGTVGGGVGLAPLVVAFTGTVTPGAAQAVLRAVGYANVSPTPLTAPRWVRASLTDDTGLVSNLAVKTVVNTAVPATPGVQDVVINDGSAQRSMVRSVTVTFSGPVTFAGNDAAAAFALTRVTGAGGAVDLTAAVSANLFGQTVVTLTFTGGAVDPLSLQNGTYSLADGRYQLSVLDGAVTGTGGALDGDGNGVSGGAYQSPTDTAGGGPGQLRLYRLFGDATGNGVVDLTDLALLRTTFNVGVDSPAYLDYLDADHSGTVDLSDLGQFRGRFNASVFG